MDALGWRKPIRGATLNPTHPLARGLVGAWICNEGTGTRVHDYSGWGNTGALVNMEQADWVPGGHGQALEFDGVDQAVDCGTMAEMDGLTELTVVTWAYGTSPSNSWDALWARYNHTYFRESVSMSSGNICLFAASVWGQSAYGATPGNVYWSSYMQGSWRQVVYRFDGAGADNAARLRCFFDGQEVALNYSGTIPSVLHSSAANLTLGAGSIAGANSITARIASALVYSRALSPAEIAWLYREPYGMFAASQVPWFSDEVGPERGGIRFMDGTQRVLASDAADAIAFRDRTRRLHHHVASGP